MEYTFEDLVGERLGKVLENQKIAEAGISNNLDGTCGEKVYEYIYEGVDIKWMSILSVIR